MFVFFILLLYFLSIVFLLCVFLLPVSFNVDDEFYFCLSVNVFALNFITQ